MIKTKTSQKLKANQQKKIKQQRLEQQVEVNLSEDPKHTVREKAGNVRILENQPSGSVTLVIS